MTETLQVPVRELTTGSTFAGRYQVIEELGHGGMGRVYKVQDTKIGEKIALKLIRPEAGLDKKSAERFSNELKLARKVRHKNVCQMFDLGEDQGTRYITMEYVHGEDLKQLIRKVGRLSPGQSIGIARQVCDGLEEAHKLGIVHRDLKPQNVMVDEEGKARIMDFGIARSLHGKGITGAGVMIGTPEYMSPEQVESKDVDERSDIYSLGVILYEMVTGSVPFEGETPFTIGIKHKSQAPQNPRTLNADLSEDLSRVILRCLEKDREKRYTSAVDLGAELEKAGRGVPVPEGAILPGRPATSREITVKLTPRKLLLPAAGLVVLIAAGLSLLLKPKAPGLDPKRIVVLPFENKTGDPALENIGFMASDWITQGLMQMQGAAVSSVQDAEALQSAQEDKDKVRWISRATRAGKVVTGAYYLEAGTLRFVAQVQDALQGRLLSAVEPESGPVQEPVKIIESLRQKVMGTLAAFLNEEVPLRFLTQFPKLRAYQAFAEGWKALHRFDMRKAIAFFDQANQEDPDFIAPRLFKALAYSDLGELAGDGPVRWEAYARVEEIIRDLEAVKGRLVPWQIVFLEIFQAQMRGDRISEYRADKRLYEIDPYPQNIGVLFYSAVRINRPREAIQVLKTNAPQSAMIMEWGPYWTFYTYAHHMLGEHEKELAVARRARKYHPDARVLVLYEIRALAAAGKVKEVERVIQESQTLPPEGGRDLRFFYYNAGRELRAHGFRKESLEFMNRALEQLRGRPDSEKKTPAYRRNLAECLYEAEKWAEAKTEYEALAKEFPNYLPYLSSLGNIAAAQGDREEALRISDEIGKVERPYLFGSIPYYQACIASLLGEKDKAVKLLQEAVAKGEVFGPGGKLHTNLALEPLADYPPFKEFMKPKG
jgi:tetratricopeptide (TPR) repeat protein/predicted Ser/Thr protein kinase